MLICQHLIFAAVCDQNGKVVSSHLFDQTYLLSAQSDDFGFVVPKEGSYTLQFLNSDDTSVSVQGISLYENK